MESIDLSSVLQAISKVRIGIVGDFCLDAYWEIDPAGSEMSVETGLATRAIRSQRYSLGGAGNVAANLLAMGVRTVQCYGVTGSDPFGHQMRGIVDAMGIQHRGLLEQETNWLTHAYIKPVQHGAEGNRIDAGNFNRLADGIADRLISTLAEDLENLDAVIINQQVRDGIHCSPRLQECLQALIASQPAKLFLLDSRSMSRRYAGAIRKINAYEAALLTGSEAQPGDVIRLDDARDLGLKLAAEWGRPVFLSRADRGCLVVSDGQVTEIPGLHIIERTDPVGAGDSLVAGITAALAAGCTPVAAGVFGNFVAGVTVRKVFQTGTATPEEILRIGESPDYIYLPEKADDSRSATFWRTSEIEILTEDAGGPHALTHAIFDHDGTISVLREGWEAIMEPMMVRAILGSRYMSADETTYHKVLQRVRSFIDATTGVQTLVQMSGLVNLVQEFEFVPADEVLDAAGYKAVYNQALLESVRQRLDKFERGELQADDLTLKGVVLFLRRLKVSGVKLYLASGSDETDVLNEARALGYADLFEGRIYGAVGDIDKDAKKMVMDRILKDIGAARTKSMAAFGDGPVEIRESRKRGGLAVGVASDEVRRFGLNSAKRRRLIRAGADFIIPDFSQTDALLELLGCANLTPPAVRSMPAGC